MRKNHNIETYTAKLRLETDGAWLLDVGEIEPVWFPKSQCEFDGSELQCPEWLAIEKGIA